MTIENSAAWVFAHSHDENFHRLPAPQQMNVMCYFLVDALVD